MPKPPFIHRVKLRNYKSIASCDVELGPLAILVGPNGSGKSNFLDALSLIHDALWMPLHKVLWERGGITEVMRRSSAQPDSFSIALHFTLGEGAQQGSYGFEITAQDNGSFTVSREICEVVSAGGDGGPVRFVAKSGNIVETNVDVRLPRVAPGRLFLISASNVDEFRPVYDALTSMNFYKFDLDVIRRPQAPEFDDTLHIANGHNLAGVLGELEENDPENFNNIQQYLSSIVPGIEYANRIQIPTVNLETIRFVQRIVEGGKPLEFTAVNMSDGTLRALAVLTALLQGGEDPPSLVGIEEPEIGLHPAAAGVLWDALADGAERTQVLVTTHSPDLLDRKDVPASAILATDNEDGRTQIGPVVESSRRALQDRLMSAGELLRQSRLTPTEKALLAPPYRPPRPAGLSEA